MQRKLQDRAKIVKDEFEEKYLAVLRDEQGEKFHRMRGPKIEVDISEIPFIFGRS